MRLSLRRLYLTLFWLLLGASLWAQSYSALGEQATRLLEEHKRDKGNGVTTPWGEKDKAYQAGDLWLEAAKLASNDLERFRAYESAGQAYAIAQTLGDEALKAFVLARDVAGASGEQRAGAGIMAARRARARSDWELVAAIPGATPQQLAIVYHEIALTYILPAKENPALNQQVAEFYEKAAAQMAKYDPRAADTELGIAQVTIAEAPSEPATVAVLDRIFKTRLALPLGDNKPLRQAMLELDWARGLEKMKSVERAIATWQAVGKNAAYPIEQRVEGWSKAADALKAQGKLDPALAALEAAAVLRADNYVYSQKIAEQKLALLEGQKRYAEALNVVRTLAKHPRLPQGQGEALAYKQARYLYRLGNSAEAEALLAPLWASPPRAGATIHDIALLKAEEAILEDPARARKELEAGLSRLKQSNDPHLPSLQEISARLYAHQKDYAKALREYADSVRQAEGIVPTQSALEGIRQLFVQAVKDKQLAVAETMIAELKTWGYIDSITIPLMQAELHAASGNAAAARESVAACRAQLGRFYGSNKEWLEKEIARIEATIH